MNYYRKSVNNVVDNVKLKMQMGALTLKLNENKNNISSNTSLIDTNVSDISTLKTDVSNNFNFTQINKKKSDNNTTFIDTNRNNIATNLSKINTIEENNLKISDEVFNNRYDIIIQSFNFNENTHSYQLFEKIIKYDFNTGELIIDTIINYKYDNLKNDLNRLTHLYQFYNDKDELIYSITLDTHDFSTSDFDENILNVSDHFCFNLEK